MTAISETPTPAFVSPLADLLARFLAFKRAAGCRYREEARALRVLDRFLTTHLPSDDPVITLAVIRRYVAQWHHESDTTRAHRLSLIRQVCRFVALDQPRTAVPASRFLGLHRRGFVPRVLTRAEGRRFLAACHTVPATSGSPLRPIVLGTALAVLYLVGLRAGELRRLTIADVDLEGPLLRIRDSKFGKSRLVPVAPDLACRLQACAIAVELRVGPRSPDAPFFPAPSGRRYSLSAVRAAFHEVLQAADIPRRQGGRALRLHDLRHSFAVLRLLLWYEQDVDWRVHLPALATYMGHLALASSQRYLQLTEDIAGEIVRRHDARFGYLITDGGRS